MCLRKILLREILHRLFEMLGLRQAQVVVAFGSGARRPSFLARGIRGGRFSGPNTVFAAWLLVGDAISIVALSAVLRRFILRWATSGGTAEAPGACAI